MLTLRSVEPVARKWHRCDWCTARIRPGTRYHRSTNIYDDRLYDWVSCLACQGLVGDVWDWAGAPDEGVDSETYAEWAHECASADPDACAYLERRGCRCEDCERRTAATLLLEAAVQEAVRIVQESRATTEVPDLLAEATRSADLLLRSAS